MMGLAAGNNGDDFDNITFLDLAIGEFTRCESMTVKLGHDGLPLHVQAFQQGFYGAGGVYRVS